jgi:hypothetical protein
VQVHHVEEHLLHGLARHLHRDLIAVPCLRRRAIGVRLPSDCLRTSYLHVDRALARQSEESGEQVRLAVGAGADRRHLVPIFDGDDGAVDR